MTSKQLANVLIKILGIDICIHSIPVFFAGGSIAALLTVGKNADPYSTGRMTGSAIAFAIQAAIGIWFIVSSRSIAEKLFKSDE